MSGKTALVTGAGSGIGEAIAVRLAREGAAVVVADIDDGGGCYTVRQIERAGGRAAFARADVASESDVERIVAFAEERFGGLDLLVNNAGFAYDEAYPQSPPERWRRVLDVCLLGVMLGSYYGIRAMRKRGGGVIVSISSGAGIGYGAHDIPEYAAAKAGVVRFTASLASLKDTDSIRVNCVCPGWVDTPWSRRTRAKMLPEELAAVPAAILPPEEIADAVMRFVEDDSLAGRVMLCDEGQPPRLVPADSEY